MTRVLVCLATLLCITPVLAQVPKDVQNSADHPLVGRFAGAVITHYAVKEFDEAKFLRAPPADESEQDIAALRRHSTDGGLT